MFAHFAIIYALGVFVSIRSINPQRRAGIFAAVLALSALIAMLNSGMDTPMILWPVEAFLGVAFAIGWLTSAPVLLAYLLAALFFLLLTVAFYLFGCWLFKILTKH